MTVNDCLFVRALGLAIFFRMGGSRMMKKFQQSMGLVAVRSCGRLR